MKTVTWHSFDLRTGRRGPQLVTAAQGEFGRIIGEPTEATASVSCWDVETQAPRPGWDAGTLPGRVMLAALDENEQPVWGGMVLRRKSTASEWVDCTATTLEHYLDRRYVGDLTFDEGTDQASIAAGVLEDLNLPVDGLDFTIDAPATGITRAQDYAGDEDKTALAVLTDLMNIEDGLEFTVDLEWADDTHTVLNRILRFRTRLGTARAVPAEFVMPGPVSDFEFTEDYSPEFGANDVMAVSSGEGSTRPTSAHHVDTELIGNGWARYENRFTPTTSVTDDDVLDSAAAQRLADMRDGIAQLQLTVNLDTAPQVNRDFWLGDDVTAVLTCPRFPAYTDADGQLRPGYSATRRCVGWSVNLDDRTLKTTLRDVP